MKKVSLSIRHAHNYIKKKIKLIILYFLYTDIKNKL